MLIQIGVDQFYFGVEVEAVVFSIAGNFGSGFSIPAGRSNVIRLKKMNAPDTRS
jgi:hypothetical protein